MVFRMDKATRRAGAVLKSFNYAKKLANRRKKTKTKNNSSSISYCFLVNIYPTARF